MGVKVSQRIRNKCICDDSVSTVTFETVQEWRQSYYYDSVSSLVSSGSEVLNDGHRDDCVHKCDMSHCCVILLEKL
jgi:hypothetical protein